MRVPAHFRQGVHYVYGSVDHDLGEYQILKPCGTFFPVPYFGELLTVWLISPKPTRMWPLPIGGWNVTNSLPTPLNVEISVIECQGIIPP